MTRVPRTAGEVMLPRTFRFPVAHLAWLDDEAARREIRATEVLRQLIDREIQKRAENP